jgi:uncharacterized lipoprotein YbaY
MMALWIVAVMAQNVSAESIQGTATYRERIALPPTAVFEATLEDVSRVDAPADVIARTRVDSPPAPPIRFEISYDPARIQPTHRYVVRARIAVGAQLIFTTDTGYPVLTAGNPATVSMMLRRAGAGTSRTANPASALSLEQTHWKATAIGGTPVAAGTNREVYLVFEAGGRLSGSDGCNRIVGSYQLAGDAMKLSQLAGTQMACPDTGDTERAFHAALGDVSRYRIVGSRLELYDTAGAARVRFEARAGSASAQTRSGRATAGLGGTSWRLVKFQGSDDKTLEPDDKAKYTVAFKTDGTLTARIDCNRGRGTWKSSGPNQLAFGPLALTRAMCPPGSLHDRVVKDWPFVRSYVIKDGHLFLSLMADGGIYEFEPIR